MRQILSRPNMRTCSGNSTSVVIMKFEISTMKHLDSWGFLHYRKSRVCFYLANFNSFLSMRIVWGFDRERVSASVVRYAHINGNKELLLTNIAPDWCPVQMWDIKAKWDVWSSPLRNGNVWTVRRGSGESGHAKREKVAPSRPQAAQLGSWVGASHRRALAK